MSERDIADIIGISARLHGDELHVTTPPRARVRTISTGSVRATRRGIPATGTKSGETYRDVEIEVRITAGTARDDG